MTSSHGKLVFLPAGTGGTWRFRVRDVVHGKLVFLPAGAGGYVALPRP